MRSAAVRCIGVFISNVPFSSLESNLSMILHTKEANLDQQFYSDSRLKLVTLAILRLGWELRREEQIGTFCLGISYRMTITGVTRAVVTDMFELPTATPRNCEGMLGERTEKSHCQHSERAISCTLDLLAATFLVLCPSNLRNKDSLVRSSSKKNSLSSEFIENVLTDGSGVVRVGCVMQEEIYKRAADRCLVSLDGDSNLSSIADSLLISDDACLSSDGELVFFNVRDTSFQGITNIYSCNIDGTNLRKVASAGLGFDFEVRTAAGVYNISDFDSSYVFFSRQPVSGQHQIWRI